VHRQRLEKDFVFNAKGPGNLIKVEFRVLLASTKALRWPTFNWELSGSSGEFKLA